MRNGFTHETNFQILVTPAGGTPYTVLAPKAASFVVDGLTNGTPYTFEVRGEDTNIAPTVFSAWSLPRPSVTPHAPQSVPTITLDDVTVVRPPNHRVGVLVGVHVTPAAMSTSTFHYHLVAGTATARDYIDPGDATVTVHAGQTLAGFAVELRPHRSMSKTRTLIVIVT